MEDLSPCTVGDDIKGCSLEQARLVMKAMGAMHSTFLRKTDLKKEDWLHIEILVPVAMMEAVAQQFLERYGDAVKPSHQDILKKLVAVYEPWRDDVEKAGPMGVVSA
jgi:hypothetical protein